MQQINGMIDYYTLLDGKLVHCENRHAQMFLVTAPDDAEKAFLTLQHEIDEHTLNSALDQDEVARLEREPGHTAIIFKIPLSYDPDNFEFAVSSMGLFLFPERLILVVPEATNFLNGKSFDQVKSLSDLMLKIISHYISHYLSHLQVIDRISDELADKISTSMENKYLLHLFGLEKSLVYYMNALSSNGVLLEKLNKLSATICFNNDDQELLEDIIIENNQSYKQAKMYSNILASMMDARASIVNNNLNILMKKLTIITIAIMVPTFVVSAFSMNVAIPLQRDEYAFWIVMTIAFAAMFGFLFFWRSKK